MTEEKTELAIGFSVIGVTEFLMNRYSVSAEDAYKKLMRTKFFEILRNAESGLFLEPEWYLGKACLLELEEGADRMIEYINSN